MRRPPKQPDGRLALDAGDRHHLVQEPVLLGSGGALIPLPLDGGVLPKAGSCHGALLFVGVGSRDF